MELAIRSSLRVAECQLATRTPSPLQSFMTLRRIGALGTPRTSEKLWTASFSAVSTPIFTIKYVLKSSR